MIFFALVAVVEEFNTRRWVTFEAPSIDAVMAVVSQNVISLSLREGGQKVKHLYGTALNPFNGRGIHTPLIDLSTIVPDIKPNKCWVPMDTRENRFGMYGENINHTFRIGEANFTVNVHSNGIRSNLSKGSGFIALQNARELEIAIGIAELLEMHHETKRKQ